MKPCPQCYGRGFVFEATAPPVMSRYSDHVSMLATIGYHQKQVPCPMCRGSAHAAGLPRRWYEPHRPLHVSPLIDTFPERIRQIIRSADVPFNEYVIDALIQNRVLTWDEAEREMARVMYDWDAARSLRDHWFRAVAIGVTTRDPQTARNSLLGVSGFEMEAHRLNSLNMIRFV